jgi:hypothetical protein
VLGTLGACGPGRQRPPPPTAAATPDPRLSAAFTKVFRDATAAASKARELHERELLSATRLDD